MKKVIFFMICTVIFSSVLPAQERQHKIVFDFTKGDTASFSTIVRHANNIMLATGNAKIEVVCHGPGINLLLKDKTTMGNEIQELQEKFKVVFAACEATMKRIGIDKQMLLQGVTTVPYANLEFSSKQQDGWSYIKSGNYP
jgi:uncharacterized protein